MDIFGNMLKYNSNLSAAADSKSLIDSCFLFYQKFDFYKKI